jgi:hypothetical protein
MAAVQQRKPLLGDSTMAVLEGSALPPPQAATAPQQDHAAHPCYLRLFAIWSAMKDRSPLRLVDFLGLSQESTHPNYSALRDLIGDAHFDRSPLGQWIFEQAATILADVTPTQSIADNNEWSHVTSHLFRGSAITPTPHRSLLDHADSRPLAEKLLQRSVQFCESSNSLGTTAVSLRGIVASNLRAWVQSGDMSSFYFRPNCLRSPQLARLLADESAHEASTPHLALPSSVSRRTTAPRATIERFCRAATPREFLSWAFSQNLTPVLPHLAEPLQALLAANSAARKTTPETEQTSSPATLSAAVTPKFNLRPGVYIDVFGTLIQEGSPNLRLVQLVHDLMRQNPSRPIFLVSDSAAEDLARELALLPRPLPEVVAKDELETCELELLIDDTEPDIQGLHVRRYLTPEEAIRQPSDSWG